jgi:hypothetical protein
MSCRHRSSEHISLVVYGAVSYPDIIRWDNGERIPGTEGVTPSAGVPLESRNPAFADFSEKNLPDPVFSGLTRIRHHEKH